ncbi:hypothetical protein D3Z52_18020 [Clostridiaceae bacterium]|jgi:hypothetical protein|nr:hypothetical protein [Clostridiaceae bacterium]NBH80025.1 hypothetical protein [Clostridiaceae bacterium]
MRESMVRELYYGNISPWERKRAYPPERIALTDKIDDIVQHFKNLLSPEEYKKFAEMQELESQVDVEDAVDLFEHAFCMGVRLMIDIFGYTEID